MFVNNAMEAMILTFDEDNYSTIDSIVYVLRSNNNDLYINTKYFLANIAKNSLNKTLGNINYLLVENNLLKDEVIVSRGNILEASNISSNTRNFGEYIFTLFIFSFILF